MKVEKVDLYSNILEKEMSMLVYLPTTYNHLNSLPVLYFLHQRRGDENIMFEIDIHTTADKLIETGKIEPMIIVCPRMENSRGVNSSIVCKEIPDPVKSHRTIHLMTGKADTSVVLPQGDIPLYTMHSGIRISFRKLEDTCLHYCSNSKMNINPFTEI